MCELLPPERVSDRFLFSFLCRLVSENSLVPSVAALLSALNLKKETGGWCARGTPKTDDPEMKAFRAKDSPEKTAIIHGVFRPMVTALFPSFHVTIYKKHNRGLNFALPCQKQI